MRLLFILAAALFTGWNSPSHAAAWGGAVAQDAAAAAAAGGEVVQIGFDDYFHPTGWVPMKVRVTPPRGESGLYQIRVHQRDLDGDQVVYQRTVTLTGGMANQEFWAYFKPEPVDGGLPAKNAQNVRSRLRVVLADADGRELAQLAVPGDIEPLYAGSDMASGNSGRGKRLVLLVADPPAGALFAGYEEYAPGATPGVGKTPGMTEETVPVGITTENLPDRWIGYSGVDAIIWQDADPALLTQGGGERMAALRQWVRAGGKLIVTARGEWQTLEPFFDLLPVTPTGAVERNDLAPLLGIVNDRLGRSGVDRAQLTQSWRAATGPFRFVVGQAKPDAIVENLFSLEQQSELGGTTSGEAPFVARRPEGFGSVTWVALDLSNPNLKGLDNRGAAGWSIIWSHLLGLGDQPVLAPTDAVRNEYTAREFKDLGIALLPGSRLAGRSVALVTVALVFFIAYWLAAGPGLYFYLAAKRRTPMSWFFFGAAAVIATLVTLGVVRLILRGPPDLRHVSVVRQGPMAPQVVHAEMGLYIPEDGVQRLVIDGGAPSAPPTLTGFAVDKDHHGGGGGRSNPIDYVVSLDPPGDSAGSNVEGSATVVDVPYRSTLKKLEVDWIGPVARGVNGTPQLVLARDGYCAGRLVNVSGHDLVNVYIAFRYRLFNTDDVYIVFLPSWKNGQTIPGINTLIRPPEEPGKAIKRVDRAAGPMRAKPSATEPVYGTLRGDWSGYWYDFYRASMIAGASDESDWAERVRRSTAMLSFFSLLPPMLSGSPLGAGDATMLLRRGATELDVSAAVTAGNMVIVAEAEEVALPVPMRVDGDEVQGAGRIVYQFVLPLNRSELVKAEQAAREERERAANEAATQPATQSATQPASSADSRPVADPISPTMPEPR